MRTTEAGEWPIRSHPDLEVVAGGLHRRAPSDALYRRALRSVRARASGGHSGAVADRTRSRVRCGDWPLRDVGNRVGGQSESCGCTGRGAPLDMDHYSSDHLRSGESSGVQDRAGSGLDAAIQTAAQRSSDSTSHFDHRRDPSADAGGRPVAETSVPCVVDLRQDDRQPASYDLAFAAFQLVATSTAGAARGEGAAGEGSRASGAALHRLSGCVGRVRHASS